MDKSIICSFYFLIVRYIIGKAIHVIYLSQIFERITFFVAKFDIIKSEIVYGTYFDGGRC